MLKQRLGIGLVTVMVLFAGTACSDDGGGGNTAAELAALMREESPGEMDEEQSLCFANAAIDAVGEGTVKKAVAAGADGGEAVMDEAFENLSEEKQAEFGVNSAKCFGVDMDGLMDDLGDVDDMDLGELEDMDLSELEDLDLGELEDMDLGDFEG